MDYFVERAATDQDVQAILRRTFGDRARILSRKEVKTGGILGMFQKRVVEVTGYCSHAPQPRSNRGSQNEERQKILNSVKTVAGDNDAQTVPPRQEPPASPAPAPAPSAAPSARGAETEPGVTIGFETILRELRSLRNQVGDSEGSTEPDSLGRVREVLEENDFSPRFSREMVARLRNELTMEQLEDTDAVLERVGSWVADTVSVYPWQERRKRPHVFVLVGPTGVGKTTTIAKLAAMYGAVADPSYDVRVLTIDSYRIGALQQIQKYGEIMNIPVHPVETASDMRKQLDLHADADFIFVDTIGKSPHDLTKLAEVNQLVRSAGGEVHLAMSATTKRSDMIDILRQFEPFNYQAVVVTKLDETSSVGGIISALQEKQKSVSFVTDGQRVPQDIERAKKESFLSRLRDLPAPRPEVHAMTKE
jgi:flagellar biosynthesis protein FlhF